jgi:hypothetical protein
MPFRRINGLHDMKRLMKGVFASYLINPMGKGILKIRLVMKLLPELDAELDVEPEVSLEAHEEDVGLETPEGDEVDASEDDFSDPLNDELLA